MKDLSVTDATIDTVVFDFDGTLAELHLDFVDMKRRLAEVAEPYLGHRPEPGPLPALEWVAALAQEIRTGNGAAARELTRAGHDLIFAMELDAARKGRLFPFTKRMLNELKQQGLDIAIITRNCRQAVVEVFPDWFHHCDCLLTREQVPKVKPDPAHLLEALRVLRSLPSHTLMVGDHPMDVETGHRARTWTAAVASGNVGREHLAEAGPDWLAADCAELIGTLDHHKILSGKSKAHPEKL